MGKEKEGEGKGGRRRKPKYMKSFVHKAVARGNRQRRKQKASLLINLITVVASKKPIRLKIDIKQ